MPKRKNPAAVALGRKGGKKKSDAKALAVRENGRKGGRPKKEPTPEAEPGPPMRLRLEREEIAHWEAVRWGQEVLAAPPPLTAEERRRMAQILQGREPSRRRR